MQGVITYTGSAACEDGSLQHDGGRPPQLSLEFWGLYWQDSPWDRGLKEGTENQCRAERGRKGKGGAVNNKDSVTGEAEGEKGRGDVKDNDR